MKIKKIISVFCLLLPGVALATPCAEAIFKARFSNENQNIHSMEAEKCIDSLSSKISLGNSKAIADGVFLFNITDASYSTSIKVSLAHALPKNPKAVLLTLESDPDLLDDVCSIPFIEPEDIFVEKYYKKTRKALTRLKEEKTKNLALLCVDRLDAVYSTIDKAAK